jgi:hypothetical protein
MTVRPVLPWFLAAIKEKLGNSQQRNSVATTLKHRLFQCHYNELKMEAIHMGNDVKKVLLFSIRWNITSIKQHRIAWRPFCAS